MSWLSIIGFFKNYWKQIAAVMFLVSMVTSVYILYKDNLSLSARLATADQDKKVAIDDYNRLDKQLKDQNKEIEDLQARNKQLQTDIDVSQQKIDAENAQNKILIAKISSQVLPKDCSGKIDVLRQQALEFQGIYAAPLNQPQPTVMDKIIPDWLKGVKK